MHVGICSFIQVYLLYMLNTWRNKNTKCKSRHENTFESIKDVMTGVSSTKLYGLVCKYEVGVQEELQSRVTDPLIVEFKIC